MKTYPKWNEIYSKLLNYLKAYSISSKILLFLQSDPYLLHIFYSVVGLIYFENHEQYEMLQFVKCVGIIVRITNTSFKLQKGKPI